jgi:hypothetical protein
MACFSLMLTGNILSPIHHGYAGPPAFAASLQPSVPHCGLVGLQYAALLSDSAQALLVHLQCHFTVSLLTMMVMLCVLCQS